MGCGISSPAGQPNGGQSNGDVRHRPSVSKQLLARFSRTRSAQQNHHSFQPLQQQLSTLPSAQLATKFATTSTQCVGGLCWINTFSFEKLLPRQANRLYELQFETVGHRCVGTQSDFQPFDSLSKKVAEAVQQISHTLIDLPGWQIDEPISPTEQDECRSIPSKTSKLLSSKTTSGLLVPSFGATGSSRRSSFASTRNERRMSRCPKFANSSNVSQTSNDNKLRAISGGDGNLLLSPRSNVATSTTTTTAVQRTKHTTSTQLRLEMRNKTSQTCLSVAHMKTSELLLQLASQSSLETNLVNKIEVESTPNDRKWMYQKAETRKLCSSSSKQRLCWKHRRRWQQSEPSLDQFWQNEPIKHKYSYRLTKQPYSDPIIKLAHSSISRSSSPSSSSSSSLHSIHHFSSPPSLESLNQLISPCINIHLPTSSSSSSLHSSSVSLSTTASGFNSIVPIKMTFSREITSNSVGTDVLPIVAKTASSQEFDFSQRPKTSLTRPQPLRPKWATNVIQSSSGSKIESPKKQNKPMHKTRQRLMLTNGQPRPHSADSSRRPENCEQEQDKSIDPSFNSLGLALSADVIQEAPASSREQRLLQEYLKNILLKVHSQDSAHHKIKRRHASIQTVNDLLTDEAPEYAARCPSLRKKELLYLPNLFADTDERAVQAPEFATLSQLVSYLIEGAENDLFTVRCLFRWICANISFNWNYVNHLHTSGGGGKKAKTKVTFAEPGLTLNSTVGVVRSNDFSVATQNGNGVRDPNPEWAETIFRRREGASKEYCVLFGHMCTLAGIRCKLLQGFAKNYDYRPGHKYLEEDIQNANARHHWTAVYVLGNWHLIDIAWATGYTDPTGKFQRNLNEFYFFTDPENLVWTHLPRHPTECDFDRWQLLDKPITLSDFNELPKVTAHFFDLNLKLRSRLANPIEFRVQTELKIAANEPMRYKYKLYPVDQSENVSLNNYVFCQLKEERLVGSFVVNPPNVGRYYFKVYAKPEREVQESVDGGSLNYVATLLLECSKSRKYQGPYPPNESHWGPATAFYDYKMQVLNQRTAVISSWGGKRKLVIQCTEPMLLTYHIIDSDGQEVDTRTMISRDDQSADNLITLHILPPRVGLFKLTIFGMPKPKQKGKWRLPLLATFLVDCRLAKLKPQETDPPPLPYEVVNNLTVSQIDRQTPSGVNFGMGSSRMGR